MAKKETKASAAVQSAFPSEGVVLKDVQPNLLLSKLPFNRTQCPLFITENGNITALYRYSNSGPFIELFDPTSDNLLPALKHSIIQGNFCNFNLGVIEDPDRIVRLLEDLKKACSRIHKDLYDHLINNTLMKQTFDTLMSLIPFDPTYEMAPEIYSKSKESFRLLFFVQIDDPSKIKEPISSLFQCIRVKP